MFSFKFGFIVLSGILFYVSQEIIAQGCTDTTLDECCKDSNCVWFNCTGTLSCNTKDGSPGCSIVQNCAVKDGKNVITTSLHTAKPTKMVVDLRSVNINSNGDASSKSPSVPTVASISPTVIVSPHDTASAPPIHTASPPSIQSASTPSIESTSSPVIHSTSSPTHTPSSHPSSTPSPITPTPSTTVTPSPSSTSTPAAVTVGPTAAPRKFDGLSFLGGILLLVFIDIAVVALIYYRRYKKRSVGRNYSTVA